MPGPPSPPRLVVRPDDPGVNGYSWMTAVVVPRPIAWVSTVDPEGAGNLAPHSFFTVASADPPMLTFSSVTRKDTLRNVEATGEFVVNLASRPLMEQVNGTSARFAPGDDEAAALGLATEPSEVVAPRRVVDSPVAVECVLHTTVGLGNSTLVVGRVVAVAVREDVLVDGYPAMSRLEPVSRLGRDEWGLPPEVVRLTRPARPEDVER